MNHSSYLLRRRLHEVLTKRQIKPQWLCAHLGCNPDTLRKYALGTRQMSSSTVFRLEAIFSHLPDLAPGWVEVTAKKEEFERWLERNEKKWASHPSWKHLRYVVVNGMARLEGWKYWGERLPVEFDSGEELRRLARLLDFKAKENVSRYVVWWCEKQHCPHPYLRDALPFRQWLAAWMQYKRKVMTARGLYEKTA